jgi:hypothetical protein
MKYTVYRLYKKTRHIGSPTKQLQLLAQFANFKYPNLTRTMVFAEGFNFQFFKII